MKRWVIYFVLIVVLGAGVFVILQKSETKQTKEIRQYVADSLEQNGLLITSCLDFIENPINEIKTVEAKRFTRNAVSEQLAKGVEILAVFKLEDLKMLLNADLLAGDYQARMVYETGHGAEDYKVYSIKEKPKPVNDKFFHFSDGRRYKGEWNGALMEGNGLMLYPDGSWYTGNWLSGVAHGTGILYAKDSTIIAEGDWNLGTFSGPKAK